MQNAFVNLLADIAESLRSIKGNKLRFFLTAAIISIGITALVGILTSLEAISQSVASNFSRLGSSGIDFYPVGKTVQRRNRFGNSDDKFKPITYRQAIALRQRFQPFGDASIHTYASYNAEIKSATAKTNPNCTIVGITPEYLKAFGVSLMQGRNFSETEALSSGPLCLIGAEVKDKLFPKEAAIGKTVKVGGLRLRVIGVLAKSGGLFAGPSPDRSVITTLETGRRLNHLAYIGFDVRLMLSNGRNLDDVKGELLNICKIVRRDPPQKNASLYLERSETAAETIANISGALSMGGLIISLITLLGAGIGLMNIMIVSVNERTQEIGIRKSIGATRAKIRNQFLTEAILVCLFGGASGIVFGLVIGNLVSNLVGNGDFIAPMFWLGVAVIASFLVGLLSGWLPAQRAAALDPIDALRYE